MATHSSVLAWRIPGTGDPGGLPSMGSHRVGHDWSDLAAAEAGHWSKITLALKSNLLKDIHNQSLLCLSELIERREAAFNDTPPHFPVYNPYVCYSCKGTNIFSSSPVQMWELDHKDGWTLKNWCIGIVVLEKTLVSPLDSKEIKVNPKENQPWIFIGRTDVEAEAPVLWPPDVKSQLIGKDSCWGRGQEEKRATEDKMFGWHHQLNGHEFGQTLGESEGQGSLVCCSFWAHKESDMT